MPLPVYAIVDIETTGGQPHADRVTEIGIVLHDGTQILDSYSSLVNPERSIPWNISQITGISDEMVAHAPKFFEIAKKIVEMTEGAIFVAHNVLFDYGFLREEFKRLGYTYTRHLLCTVRLSRKAFPQFRYHNLGSLIEQLGISVVNRHRALDDALATAQLFEIILKKNQGEHIKDLINKGLKETKLPAGLSLESIQELPEACGVYYFQDSFKDIIYVGKSINIRKRVQSHFADHSPKARKLHQQVCHITYYITGSELISLLLEAQEIKTLQPAINKALRATEFPFSIQKFTDENNYWRLAIANSKQKKTPKGEAIEFFSKSNSAYSTLRNWVYQYELCEKLCDLQEIEGPCFQRQVKICHGACEMAESPEAYNSRVQMALDSTTPAFTQDFFIVEAGRTQGERAIVLVQNGKYAGYGFFEDDLINDVGVEEMLEAIIPATSDKDMLHIIGQYLRRGNVKIIYL